MRTALLLVWLLPAACVTIPIPASYPDDRDVSGLVVDQDGKPVQGVVIRATRTEITPGDLHKPARYNVDGSIAEFVTGEDGRYSGRLPFDDPGRRRLGQALVRYSACKVGYQERLIYHPKRGVIVLLPARYKGDQGKHSFAMRGCW